MEELLSLKWNNHHTILLHMFNIIRQKELYTDVTLVCEGKFYNVHKIVLATCSLYFNEVFSNVSCSNPVIILREIKSEHLEYLLDYMYIGEVKVKQIELNYLIKTAEHLKIKGLAAADNEALGSNDGTNSEDFNDNLETNGTTDVDFINDNEEMPDIFGDSCNRKRKPLVSPSTKKRRKSREKRDIDVETFMSAELSGVSDATFASNETTKTEADYVKLERSDHSEKANKCYESDTNNDIEDPFEHPCSILNSSAENTTDDSYAVPGGSDELNPANINYDTLTSNSISDSTLNEYPSLAKTIDTDDRRKVICTVCGKRMKWPSQLLVHMRTHTGERPFLCKFCSKTFSQKIHRKRHMLIKHNLSVDELSD